MKMRKMLPQWTSLLRNLEVPESAWIGWKMKTLEGAKQGPRLWSLQLVPDLPAKEHESRVYPRGLRKGS